MEPHYTWPGGLGGKEVKAGSVPWDTGEREECCSGSGVGWGGDRRVALHVDMNVSVEVVHVGRRRKQPGEKRDRVAFRNTGA